MGGAKRRVRKSKKTKKRSCKRRRVRKNPDGSFNKKDLEHNQKCYDKYVFLDNPWMKNVSKKRHRTQKGKGITTIKTIKKV